MQRGFGQFCPVALASEVLTQRWTLLILRELMAGSNRFNDIRRGVPRISASLLKERLDTLENAQIVGTRVSRTNGVNEYFLTEAGRELQPVLVGIGEWGQRWARDIKPADFDPGWLVWNIRRRMNTAAMPRGQIRGLARNSAAAIRAQERHDTVAGQIVPAQGIPELAAIERLRADQEAALAKRPRISVRVAPAFGAQVVLERHEPRVLGA